MEEINTILEQNKQYTKTIRKIFNKYIEKKSNDLFLHLLKSLIKIANKNNNLYLLDKILENNPNADLLNMNIEIFENPKYLEEYNIDFIARNIEKIELKFLDSGIRDPIIKEKLIVMYNNNIPIYSEILYSCYTSPDFILKCKNILKNTSIMNFCNSVFNFDCEDIRYLEFISTSKEEQDYFNFFVYNFYIIPRNNYKDIINHKFDNIEILINLILKSKIKIDMSFEEFISFYNKNEELLCNIKKYPTDDIIEKFKIYFNNRQFEIKTIEDLKNIEEKIYETISNDFDSFKDIEELKKKIIRMLFGINYETFLNTINKINNLNEINKVSYTNRELEILYKLNMFVIIENKDDLKIIFNNLYNLNLNNFFDGIQNKYNNYCKSEIVDSLYKENAKLVELNGQDFNLLVHRIKGHKYRDIANKLHQNPKLWTQFYVEDSFISTSLISELFLGVDDGVGTILGFNSIDPNDILDMGTEDINSSIELFKSQRKNPKSNYLPSAKLIEKTNMLYNEVAIKRYRNNDPIIPDCVVCFDEINDNDKNIANFFEIPIYLIHVEKYIEKMNQNLLELMNSYKFKEYYDYRNKKLYSISNNNKLLVKEFCLEKLNEELELLILKMNEYISLYDSDDLIEECNYILKRILNKNKNAVIPKLLYKPKKYKFDSEDINKYLKLTK